MSEVQMPQSSADIETQLKNREEVVWLNPYLDSVQPYEKLNGCGFPHIKAAQNRFMRYLPYVASTFPETAAMVGVIESPLVKIPEMKEWLNARGAAIEGELYLKDDARMPIAGSVKARGGIHAVMKIAEMLTQKAGNFMPVEDHKKLDSDEFRQFFSQYTIQVGSTGNLGIAIGKMAAKMGFHVIVHMSSDAKEWKKDLLRKEGVIVKEYDGDYTSALAKGREESAQDEKSIFIDDENSEDLFFGYATAALRLKVQLRKERVYPDADHPLFVYIPCGVGGAPGGLTFGLKELFGDAVHCFFVEPVEAPCMLLGMESGKYSGICVQDIGLTGKTLADGLAVGRPSDFSCTMMENLMSGDCTVSDEHLLEYQKAFYQAEKLYLEPSACAGFKAAEDMAKPGSAFEAYLEAHDLKEVMANATHIVWGTGGGLVPEEIRKEQLQEAYVSN